MDQTHDANRDESARIAEILFIFIYVPFSSTLTPLPYRRGAVRLLLSRIRTLILKEAMNFLCGLIRSPDRWYVFNLKDGDQFISMSFG